MKYNITLLVLLLISPLTSAHKSSDSFINLTINDQTITGRWDIALRDLEYALALDIDSDGAITWHELHTRYQEIEQYAFSRLHINQAAKICTRTTGQLQVDRHSDGTYAVINFKLECPASINQLNLSYQLFFDLDPSHRGLAQITKEHSGEFIVFSPEYQQSHVDFKQSNHWQTFSQFINEGIKHIWLGYDHILFLLCLLLPSVVNRTAAGWIANDSFSNSLNQVGKIVTAFTLAHSITLALAVLQIVSLPSRLIESAIAFSVILVAINNLYPFFRDRAWLVAFTFGLIHGFGFASVLTDLNLTTGNLGVSLLGFNMGVEIGQLAIVAIFLPLAYLVRKQWFYQRIILNSGSFAILLLALLWFLQRAFDLEIPQV